MEADDLQFVVSYFFNIPKIVPGMHVGLEDTEGLAILSI